MAVRQRAIQAEDKQERRDAILDAAEQVLLLAPERVASVAEVASHAGLAKGTVYLYFPSKEELLLAVHERRGHGFFLDLIALVESEPGVDFDAVFALARIHLIDPPVGGGVGEPPLPPAFAWHYPTELESALRALWRGMMIGSAASGGTLHE